MEPVVGMLRRFLGMEVNVTPRRPKRDAHLPDERAQRRTEAFARALAPPLDRWKVRPTVFAPTLPWVSIWAVSPMCWSVFRTRAAAVWVSGS